MVWLLLQSLGWNAVRWHVPVVVKLPYHTSCDDNAICVIPVVGVGSVVEEYKVLAGSGGVASGWGEKKKKKQKQKTEKTGIFVG